MFAPLPSWSWWPLRMHFSVSSPVPVDTYSSARSQMWWRDSWQRWKCPSPDASSQSAQIREETQRLVAVCHRCESSQSVFESCVITSCLEERTCVCFLRAQEADVVTVEWEWIRIRTAPRVTCSRGLCDWHRWTRRFRVQIRSRRDLCLILMSKLSLGVIVPSLNQKLRLLYIEYLSCNSSETLNSESSWFFFYCFCTTFTFLCPFHWLLPSKLVLRCIWCIWAW